MELGNRPLITTARLLAFEAHKGILMQNEDGDVRPQTVHLQEVADLVWASGGSDEEIAAAWLHDSLEDTSLTHEEIVMHCGETVASIVHGLTDYDEWTGLPVLERKSLQAARIQGESESVRRVKLCDQTSNVRAVALSRPLSMTPEECAGYVEGARRITEYCRGINPLLDGLFDAAYQKATVRWGSVS